MQSGLLSVAHGELAWLAGGSGPPIVLVHGFSFDQTMWQPQRKSLARHFRVVTYDLRGFGASSKPYRTYDHVEDLAAIVAATCDQAPVLVGLSLGANVVLEFAWRFPQTARGILLASPGLPGHVWRTERPPEVIRICALEHGVEAAREKWIDHPIYRTLASRPAAFAAFVDMVRRYDGWHWTNDDPRNGVADLAASLPGITTPAQILSGGRDDPGYREIATRLACELPHARIETFAASGHLLNMEQPKRFSAVIIDFEASLR